MASEGSLHYAGFEESIVHGLMKQKPLVITDTSFDMPVVLPKVKHIIWALGQGGANMNGGSNLKKKVDFLKKLVGKKQKAIFPVVVLLVQR